MEWLKVTMVKSFITLAHGGKMVIYHWILILKNVGTAVNYHDIFTTLALGVNVSKKILFVSDGGDK